MKKYLIIIVSLCLVTGCHTPDELVRDNIDNVSTLTVFATLVQNSTEYPAVVDEEFRTVTFEVPYYISDTEEIMSDLSAIKFRANMPLGAVFEPSLTGIHDMSDDNVFVTTLVKETGERIPYTFRAVRKKSDASSIVAATVTSEDVRVTVNITEPTESTHGKLTILNTSGSVADAISSTLLTASPWATIYAPGYDPETGIADLNYATEITVVSQDGTSKSVYDVSLEMPQLVPMGTVGYISGMFGIQCTGSNTYGFEPDANYTIAIVGSYLIVSNRNDFNKMLVFNRFSGRKLDDVTVNTSGIDADIEIRAITSDGEGRLVAFSYTSSHSMDSTGELAGQDCHVTPSAVKAWIWLDGIESAPTQIIDDDINGPTFTSMVSDVTEIGNTVCVKGSLTSGPAVLTTIDKFVSRIIMFHFQDGRLTSVTQECPNISGSLQWVSTWNSSKAIPTSTSAPVDYFLSQANQYQQVRYQDGLNLVNLEVPTSRWWAGSGAYDKDIRGFDFVEFNGMWLLAIANGYTSGGNWYHRLYVANVTNVPYPEALTTGFIFDSRESTEISGAGYSPSGMTSTYPFTSGDTPLGGNNYARRGDVVFRLAEDGNSVQVYMMNTNAGLFAYEITRYDM